VKKPLVTVIMPVFNAERYLDEAIESILNQSFEGFELVVVDDFSSDSSAAKARALQTRDPRVRLLQNQQGKGVAGARNTGIANASGELIAWMDADDVSAPTRLEAQIEYLREHPEISVCGTHLAVYEDGAIWRSPPDDARIRAELLFNSPLFQPTILMRARVFAGSPERYREVVAEDYDLWARLSLRKDVAFGNLPRPLLRYRVHPGKDRTSYKRAQRASADATRRMLLARLEILPDQREYSSHEILFSRAAARDNAELHRCGTWLRKIHDRNERLGVYDGDGLRSVLASTWEDLCRRSSRNASLAPFEFYSSPFTRKNLRGVLASLGMLYRRVKAP
jgi:glycosyltransferase involved in cell wall biosynthesis